MPGTAAGRSEIPPGERDGDWHSHSDTVAVQDSGSGCKTPVLERSTQLYARHARGCILFISFPGPADGSNKQLLSRDKELRIMVLYCMLFARLINARHWPHNKKRTSDSDEKMHTRVRVSIRSTAKEMVKMDLASTRKNKPNHCNTPPAHHGGRPVAPQKGPPQSQRHPNVWTHPSHAHWSLMDAICARLHRYRKSALLLIFIFFGVDVCVCVFFCGPKLNGFTFELFTLLSLSLAPSPSCGIIIGLIEAQTLADADRRWQFCGYGRKKG